MHLLVNNRPDQPRRVHPRIRQRHDRNTTPDGQRQRQPRTGDNNTGIIGTQQNNRTLGIAAHHMQNGQLKPGYNIQISTNTQFIVNYTAAQTTADTTTFKDHLTEHQDSFNQTPETLTADAGYGSEENYQALEDNEIEGFVKYNYFHKEQRKKKKEPNPFLPDNLYYNPEQDCYYCPMGQKLENIGQYQRETKTGYTQTIHRYQAQNCQGCPLRAMCHKAQGNRVIV